jgi:polyhydroxyalkanoate synthesis regulator phasin
MAGAEVLVQQMNELRQRIQRMERAASPDVAALQKQVADLEERVRQLEAA